MTQSNASGNATMTPTLEVKRMISRQSLTSQRLRAVALLIVGLAAAGQAGPARAYTYMEAAYGSPMIGLTSRAVGMGGAITAMPDGSFSLVSNPAMMANEERRVADVTFRGIRYDETRFVPLFDTFDSYVKETAVAENPKSYYGLNGGILWRPLKQRTNLVLSGGFFERYNNQFNFVDERRNGDGRDAANRDKVYATQFINSGRAIYSASAGLAYKEKVLSMGVGVHYYFGDLSFSNKTAIGPGARPSSAPANTPDVSLSRHLDAVGATFGVGADVTNRLTVAASYDLPVKFNVDYVKTALADTAIGHTKMDYPGRLAVGLSFRPRNVLGTTFTLDVARTFWEDLKDPLLMGTSPIATVGGVKVITVGTLRNANEYRAGLEHVFYNNLPARFGFFYREAYAAREVDQAGISFGTGYNYANFDLGFAAEVSKRSSRQTSVTPRATNDPKTDRVQDSFLRAVLDVRYHF